MVRWSRYAYAVLAWLFLAGIVAQTFYAGLGLFADGEGFETHIALGWTLHLAPILVLLAGALGRVGRSVLLWTAALVATVLVQPFLPLLRESAPIVAALHPVNALIIFWLSYVVARRSLELARTEPESAPATQAT